MATTTSGHGMTVTDEEGVRHNKCHGVPGEQWFKMINVIIIALSKPDRRHQFGLAKITASPLHRCDDPDCNRLNRRLRFGPHAMANYKIMEELALVRPVDRLNLKERKICEEHPRFPGQYLCENCARVATTKRIIDLDRAQTAGLL